MLKTSSAEWWYTVLVGGLASSIVYVVGGIDKLFIGCTIFVILDYLTGVLSAWYTKSLSSSIGFRGLAKKLAMLIFIIVGNQIDLVAGNSEHFMRNVVMVFIVGTEGISILENLGKMGVKAPQILFQSLEKFRDGKSTESQMEAKKEDA